MVWPCTWTAATPVGARTTMRLAVVARKYCNRVDLPVPARPVRNTEVRVCSSSRSTAAASACSVSWGLAWRRVRSRCRSDRCGVRRSIACASLSPPATPASHYAAGAALGGSPGFHQRPPGVVACCRLWSAKLSLPSPFRGCEVLELAVDLIQIKGLWIKFAPYPVHHLLMLGVLGVADCFQQTRIAPDAPTILGRAGAFPRETERVALPRLQRQYFFHEQLVLPAIPE